MSRRTAILGAGIGAQHLDGYLALGDRFEIASVCDLDHARADALAKRAGARVSASIAEVLADASVEIVDICLPPALHAPVACDALCAGKHVICEKPLAGSLVEAERIAATAAETGRRVFPVFQYRFGRAFDRLDVLRRRGLLGQPRVATLETHWSRDADYYANPWRGTWDYELGGAVLSHAIHIHDLIGRFFSPIAAVSATLATSINPIETEDCAAISFRLSCGALATSSITLGSADDRSRLRFVFEHASLESGRIPYAPGRSDWEIVARDPSRQADLEAIIRNAATRAEGFAGFFDAVDDALDGRDDRAPTLADGLASIELATAIYQADRTGERVSLPLDRTLAIREGWRDGAS